MEVEGHHYSKGGYTDKGEYKGRGNMGKGKQRFKRVGGWGGDKK
jgi:hypothetical protein